MLDWNDILFYYKIEVTRIENDKVFGTFEIISKDNIIKNKKLNN
jgi:hypothetical protein